MSFIQNQILKIFKKGNINILRNNSLEFNNMIIKCLMNNIYLFQFTILKKNLQIIKKKYSYNKIKNRI